MCWSDLRQLPDTQSQSCKRCALCITVLFKQVLIVSLWTLWVEHLWWCYYLQSVNDCITKVLKQGNQYVIEQVDSRKLWLQCEACTVGNSIGKVRQRTAPLTKIAALMKPAWIYSPSICSVLLKICTGSVRPTCPSIFWISTCCGTYWSLPSYLVPSYTPSKYLKHAFPPCLKNAGKVLWYR